MIYECKHFDIEELVPPETMNLVSAGDRWKLWMLFDPLALMTLDSLRDRYGTTYVNDWAIGRKDKYRGYRPYICRVGSQFSQHRRGAAFDLTFVSIDAYEVRGELKAMTPMQLESAGFQYITRIEDSVSWFHFDMGNWVDLSIRFFNP